HPPGELARGELVFAPAIGLVPLAIALIAAIAVAWWAVSLLRSVATTDRIVLGAIRTGVFLLLGVCLLRPTLVLSRAIAQRNVLAIVLDDSQSMRVIDAKGISRADAVRQRFADSTDLVRTLGDRFTLRFYS